VSLTFRHYVPRERARTSLKRWLRLVAKEVVRGHFRVVWVIERRHVGEQFHVHTIIEPLNGASFNENDMWRWWRQADRYAGHVDLERYRRGPSDEHSIESYIGKDAEWDIAIVCHRPPACRRKHACTLLSAPWI
jgi:hypothetical protein